MSASLLVDLGNTCQLGITLPPTLSGNQPASGTVIGNTVDCLLVNTFTNLMVTCGASLSGQFKVQVQTSDTNTSGSFTDPTSGLAAFPTAFQSGGILIVNSGQSLSGGGSLAAGFLNPNRYVRANIMSGDLFTAPVTASIINQKKVTGSGTGYSYSPQTNSPINV